MKPLALDLFCCAGGASMGLHRAGFDVIGVDIRPQPHYPFQFVRADALRPPFDLRQFDFIWASPPCQAHTALKTMHNAKDHEDLIPQTREMLEASGVLYVIENVPGAPLRSPIMLCGTMFGLGIPEAELRRHRNFETGPEYWSFPHAPCRHRKRTIGVYGGGHGVSLHRHAKGHASPRIKSARRWAWIGLPSIRSRKPSRQRMPSASAEPPWQLSVNHELTSLPAHAI